MSLKMTFNHQSSRDGLFSQNYIKRRITLLLFMFVKNRIFDLGIDF